MKYVYTSYCVFFLLCCTSVFGQGSRGAFLKEIDKTDAAFLVKVEADSRDCVYAEGDTLIPTVTSAQDGFLYLFYRDANADVSVLFPNHYERDNSIQQGKPVTVRRLPTPEREGYQIKVGPPFGNELLKAVVSKKPLSFINKMVYAKFNAAPNGLGVPVNDREGSDIAGALERADVDWVAHEINITTVKSRGGNVNPPIPQGGGVLKTAKIHLILAADISSADNVGGVVASDTHNLRKLIENNVAADRLNIIDLQDKRRGNQLTKDDMLREIRNLNADSNDTVFFFYSGQWDNHGEIAMPLLNPRIFTIKV